MNNITFIKYKVVTKVAAFILIGSVGLFHADRANAQQAISLSEYREQVLDYSNALKMSEESLSASEHKYRAANSGYYPSLSVAADANYVINMPQNPLFQIKNYAYSANLTLQQNIYTGHSVKNQSKVADLERKVASMNLLAVRDQVLYGADITYWSLVASVEQLDVAKEYLSIVSSLYDIVNIRFEDGYVSRTDLLMVQTRLNEAKIQLTQAEKFYYMAIQNFNTMLGDTTVNVYSPTDSLFRVQSFNYDTTTLSYALDRRPDYLAAEGEVAVQERVSRLTRAKFNPQLVAGVQAVYGTPSLNTTGTPNLYGVVFASFRAPIFAWNERRNTVAQSRAGQRAKEWNLKQSKDKVNQELNNSKIGLKQSLDQTEIALVNLRASQENLELNTYSYSEGKIPILDVLQAQLYWIQAYTSAVNSFHSYHIAVADYQKAIGSIGL